MEKIELTDAELELLADPDGPWICDDWDGLREAVTKILTDRLRPVQEVADLLLSFDCVHDPVPARVDVPDDYEEGMHDAGVRVREALRNPPVST